MSTTAVQRRPRSRLGTIGLVIGVLATLWSGIWFLVQKEVEQRLDRWLAQEAGQGREWACSNRKVGGFPFSLNLSCQSVRMESDTRSFGLGTVDMRWRAYRPWRVDVAIDGPLRFSDGNRSIDASWRSARVHIRIQGRASGRIALSLSNLDASVLGSETLQPSTVKAQNCEMNVDDTTPIHGNPGIDTAIRAICSDISASDLAAILRNPAPVDVTASVILTKAELLRRNLGRTALDDWRDSGGQISLNNVSLNQQTNRMAMTGELKLDEDHRPAGKIDLTSQGFDILAMAMGQPPKSNDPSTDQAKNRKPVTVPTIRLTDGKISIGPLTVPNVRLKSLY